MKEMKDLTLLAETVGLILEWEDSDGEPCRLSTDIQRTMLDLLGFPADDEPTLRASLDRAQRLRHPQEPAQWPPLITAESDTVVTLPSSVAPGTPYHLQLEEGGAHEGQVDAHGCLPAVAQTGYHRLAVCGVELTLAVAPRQCFSVADAAEKPTPRVWGLATQLYALRREGDGGIGDLQALQTLARHAAKKGAQAIAISPTHAMFSAWPDRYSPYAPSSRLVRNALYAAPEMQFGDAPVKEAIRRCGLEAALQRLETEDLIDWPTAGRHKLTWLRALFDDFIARDDEPAQLLKRQWAQFRQQGGAHLEDHCRFEALQASRPQESWHDWPEALRRPDSPEVARFAADNAHEVDFHAFLQWLVAEGLSGAQSTAREAGMAIGLIADLAVGADGAGSQTWSRQEEMLQGVSIGAPPDTFNVHGQDWGLASFSPHGLIHSGFRSFIDMLRVGFSHAGGLRIDHALGLLRLWLVPHGAPPTQGAYLRFPFKDMLRLVALESWRHRGIVIGEDLGTVASGFREALASRHILGMQVLWFEQDEQGDFLDASAWTDDAMATSSTHDLPTIAGWWAGRDIEWRSRLGLLAVDQNAESESQARREARANLSAAIGLTHPQRGPSTLEAADFPISRVLDTCVRHLGRTPAPLMLLPVEDALGLEEQANLPATLDEHPNWRRRWTASTEELLESPEVAERLAALAMARGLARQNVGEKVAKNTRETRGGS
ncbi:4-alpha-glucanotransferase [Halomonas korlensis]|uniref:4-alpha-glucanotransferase n=1 Tax=Halomonas korlensis TaxID=463301 RepID=A0A1I7G8Z0_9GAMM|nr:4-alpha-glucanotransferase [Halomonas korlensis]SFU44897.1 4-alpha-glucanotransferase [Halomonas korlensis]